MNRDITDDIIKSKDSPTSVGDVEAKFAAQVAMATEVKALERDVLAIVNTIVASNFKEHMSRILKLNIDNEQKLQRVVDIIYEKAISTPELSKCYAIMCWQMKVVCVTVESTPEQSNSVGKLEFRKLLLNKCQREFERNRSDGKHHKEQTGQLKEDYETAQFNCRQRASGNIKFIAELFKLKMLTEPIMHFCIETLLRAKDEDRLELMCQLLTMIGKDLDHAKAKQRLDLYFNEVRKIISEKRVSMRVRFMFQDVDDLRNNNWVPRLSRAARPQRTKAIAQSPQDAKNEQEMQRKLALTLTPRTLLQMRSSKQLSTEKLKKDMKEILDGLPQSPLQLQAEKVLELNINTEWDLEEIVDIIFEKVSGPALYEMAPRRYCCWFPRPLLRPAWHENDPVWQLYGKAVESPLLSNRIAQLCICIKALKAPPPMKPGSSRVQVNFKEVLLMKCQHIVTVWEQVGIRDTSPDERINMMRKVIMIGKDLDTPQAKRRLDLYFDQIKKIIAEKPASSRVRFMLQDVDDLRTNNWVPRAVQSQGPKTISQIRQDAKNEQEMFQLKLASTPTPETKLVNNRGHHARHKDGLTKVQTPKPTRFDPSKMKLIKANTDETKVTLDPSRGFDGLKSGIDGSSLMKTGSIEFSPSASMDRTPEGGGARSNTPTNMMNRFSALDHEYQRRPGGRQNSRDGGSRSGLRRSMGPPSTNSGGRTPRRDERSSLLEAMRKITSADRSQESRRQRSRQTIPSVPKPRPATPLQTVPAHQYNTALDEDKMRQKSKSIFEEFLSIVDFKEATECIEELNAPPSLMNCFVYVTHEFTLEKKRIERVNTGRLMAHLLKRGRLSVEQYVKGLAELLEMATDYEIDVPKVWEYFAEQLSPVFHAENDAEISINVLGTLAAPLQEEDRSGVFVAEIVKEIVKQVSIDSFSSRWQKCNLRWSKILGNDGQDVVNFLKKHGLEALVDCEGRPEQNQEAASTAWQSKPNNQYRLERDITELLDRRLQNDEIFDWVEKTLSPEAANGPDFIRALTIAVSKRSLSRDAKDADKMMLDEDKITERSILLNKYIENRPARELQVLYALQSLMVELEQPRDVLRKFFDIFYNEDVVQEQTFYKWKKSDDPNEQEGRGVAVASVNLFFTWLRTAEPESD